MYFFYYIPYINIKYIIKNYKNYNNIILIIIRLLVDIHVQDLFKEENIYAKLMYIVKETNIYKKQKIY